MSMSLKEAQTIVELAQVRAERIGVPMNIAVVDGGGQVPRSRSFSHAWWADHLYPRSHSR